MKIVLMYHDVYRRDTNESGFLRERDLPYKLKADCFEQQVKAIDDYCQKNNLEKEYVVFTFDDGGKSFYSVIAPILEKYGYKGLFFISTKYIGTSTFLNEEEIKDLYNRGHIIGSHAHTHEHLYTLTDEEVENEWKESVSILSHIVEAPIQYASIPNGDTSKRVLASASKYGIKHIYTSEPTTKVGSFGDMNVIGRYVIFSDSTIDYVMSIISSPSKRFVLSCKRSVLKVIKSMLGSNYIKLKNRLYKTC